MDRGQPESSSRAELGLCFDCRHRIEQRSNRGSVFHRCGKADEDDRFPRYPPMPVARCGGYEGVPPSAD